ncbi:MAG TPA: DUF1707 domain-containing protein [Acidimicrobiales bacterium]|nr:DUF1707 domain-containing protein [Acidimicrobiales bacterium]
MEERPEPRTGPRASDEERERFAAILQRHFAEGRLGVEEFSERVDRVLRARTLGELYELVADLPQLPAVERPSTPVRPARRHWWRRHRDADA